MLFILDAIQCAAEEAAMFVEEKAALWDEERTIKRMRCREAEQEPDGENPDKNPTEEDETADECLDSFNEYLRECAMGVLSPFGTQKEG